MNGGDSGRRWKILKQRLGFKVMGCCGTSWSLGASNMRITESPRMQDQHDTVLLTSVGQILASETGGPAHVGQIPAASGMNLATALAAERNSQANVGPTKTGPFKTLMRLLEETDGDDWKKRTDHVEEGGFDGVCCVCMERSKGAAFIPCGHTFCRVCSRELWVSRGTCPICNRSVLEILDIF